MADEASFEALLLRVRKGDAEAARTLVERYEPAIRRAVRFRLSDSPMRRTLDSVDICQSVLASFFVRVAAGQYDLVSADQLLKLLVAMARNKLAFQTRRELAQRRDARRNAPVAEQAEQISSADSSPSQHAAGRELLEEFHRRLGEEERKLAELRRQNLDWQAIAEQVGGSPEALRKKLARAVERVARELELDDFTDE